MNLHCEETFVKMQQFESLYSPMFYTKLINCFKADYYLLTATISRYKIQINKIVLQSKVFKFYVALFKIFLYLKLFLTYKNNISCSILNLQFKALQSGKLKNPLQQEETPTIYFPVRQKCYTFCLANCCRKNM